MKTKLQLAAVIAIVFAFQMSAQNRAVLNAMNSDISDNLDLTAVSSIFGESQDLNDFERRLNDPQFQVSNLDLNNDNRVDYLRVIESVERRTHVIIIQSVLGADLYQDVATIEIEKNKHNKVSVQIVGNEYIYGQNYIYEPIYVSTPKLYVNFWTNYYRPYYSSWTWNYYPTFYVAWNPYPVYRYRENVYGCVNTYNTYNYVNYRKCYRAPAIYTSYSRNSYERRYPEYAFARRNSTYSNRYEMNQKRYTTSNEYRGNVSYSNNNSRRSSNYSNTAREYSQNRTNTSRGTNAPIEYKADNTPNRTNTQRVANGNSNDYKRDYDQTRGSSTREVAVERKESPRDNNQNRSNTSRDNYSQKEYSQNTNNATRENNSQRTSSQRNNSQNRSNTSRENNIQRSDSHRNSENTSRGSTRRI